jgi:P4 family phage/plasmid primase-like protien
MTDHPVKDTDFLKYAGTKLESFVHPIIPVGVTLSDTSNLTAGHLGKIPGVKKSDGTWTGMPWHSNRATVTMLDRWQKWQVEIGRPIALGFRLGELVVLDLDTDDPAYRDAVWKLANEHFGETVVVRCREESVRIVLCYRRKPGTAPIRKFYGKYQDENGVDHLAEFLATGQQVVAEGPHAKGKMHYWLNGVELVEWYEYLPEVTVEMVDGFFRALKEMALTQFGYTEVKTSLPSSSDHASAVSINDIFSPHLAKDKELLARAINEIDLDDPRIDYDTFINLIRAVCAACGGDLEFLHNVVWPWVCDKQTVARGAGPRTEERGVEWLEERWRSFTDSQLGADFVYGWAAQFGFTEGKDALTKEMFDGLTDGITDDTTDTGAAQGSQGDGGPASPPGGGGSGPLPLAYTDMALAELFAAQNPDWKHTKDEGWMKLTGGVYVPDNSILYPIGQMCSAIGDPYRAQGPQGAKIDVAMKGVRTHERVEKALRAHPTMLAKPKDFDNEPWLINTPEFIIDLRDGSTYPHGMLMRYQTDVTPDFSAYGSYEMACPRWLEVLHNMTEDDEDIALLGRHGAAGLVGTDLDQLLLFIFGQGGTGKSAFSDVLMRVDGSYNTSATNTLFMKHNDKRPYELGDIAHARGLFVPETLKGMTWDDALICSLLGGVKIRTERKFRDSQNHRVFMTITITGNHLPHFITSSEPNKSGIDRRLLLLPVNKLLKVKPDVHFTRKLVAEEGPAILMWLIDHAMAGWRDLQATGSFYGDTTTRAKAAADAYKQSMSPHLEWMKETDIVIEHGARMNSHEAWRSYKEWVKDDNPLHRETKKEFRDNIAAATKGQVTYGRFGDERVFFGMRGKGAPAGANVVPFPSLEDLKDCAVVDGGDAKK